MPNQLRRPLRYAFSLTIAVATLGQSSVSPLTAQAATTVRTQVVSVPDPFAPLDCGTTTNQAFRERNSPHEPAVAVNPANTQNIVVAYTVDGNISILVRASNDGGATWTTVLVPGLTICTGGTAQGVGDPSIAFAADGQTLYLTSNETDVFAPDTTWAPLVNRSTCQPPLTACGFSWSSPTRLAPTDGLHGDWNFVTTDASNPAAAFVLFERHNADFSQGPLYFVRTNDRGQTWSPPSLVYTPAMPGLVTMPGKVWRTADGRLVAIFRRIINCVYVDDNVNDCLDPNTVQDNILYSSASVDEGETWAAPVYIGEVTIGPGSHVVGGCHMWQSDPSARAADGTVYAVLGRTNYKVDPTAFLQSASLDVYATRDGTAWTLAGSLSGNRMALPAIEASPDGSLGLLYYQTEQQKCVAPDGSNTLADVWFARSRNGGQTWATTKLTGPFDPATDCYLAGTPAEDCSIADYSALAPFGRHGFAAFYEVPRTDQTDGRSDMLLSSIGNQ